MIFLWKEFDKSFWQPAGVQAFEPEWKALN